MRAANGIFDWLIQSLAVAGSAVAIGFDRERAFHPTVLNGNVKLRRF